MIAVLPISRCLVETEVVICDSIAIHPPGTWHGLALVPELPSSDSIAGLATNASGITPAIIESSALVIYQNKSIDSNSIGASHKDDLFFLQRVASECESWLDIARFDMCQLYLPDTVFGRVGNWYGSNGASGGVFFDLANDSVKFIGGRYLVSTVTAGIGLDFFGYRPHYQHRKDEIGNVLKHALRLYRDALEAADWTSKYLHCVRLFEVLADPFQLANSNKWDKVKSKVCSHLAKSKQDYLAFSDRFKVLGNIGDGNERGLRERVIHHGELLENVFDSSTAISTLFREVDGYLHKVVSDLMEFKGHSWQQVEEWRAIRLSSLGVGS